MEHEKAAAVGTRTRLQQSQRGGRRPTAGRGTGVRGGRGATLCALVTLAAASPTFAQFGPGGPGSRAAAPPSVSRTWTEREFLLDSAQQPVFGEDHAVDIVHWIDDKGTPFNVQDDEYFVYVTGWMTTEYGATVFATHKYKAPLDSQTQWLASVTFPAIPSQAVGTNKAVAMEVDPTNGDIYVTGESLDQGSTTTGQDYVTIRYDKNLIPLWSQVSRYNRIGVDGDDIPADIFVMGETLLVTGRSFGGLIQGDDYATVLLNKIDGTFSTLWPAGVDPGGVRIYNGTGNGDDYPIGVTGVEIVDFGDLAGVWAWVGGTSLRVRDNFPDPDTFDTDITTLAYAFGGGLWGERNFSRPIAVGYANDVATAMASEPDLEIGYTNWVASWLVMGGYTDGLSAVAGDTDYVVLNYVQFDGLDFLVNAWSGTDSARYVNGPSGHPSLSHDQVLAMDVGDSRLPGVSARNVWVTGKVGELFGLGDDTYTIVYDMSNFTTPSTGIASWMTGVENADDIPTAIQSHEDKAYLTGSNFRGSTNYMTRKYDIATSSGPIWSIEYNWQGAIDFGQAILAFSEARFNKFPVFVTGGSVDSTTAQDQLTIRYDQP